MIAALIKDISPVFIYNTFHHPLIAININAIAAFSLASSTTTGVSVSLLLLLLLLLVSCSSPLLSRLPSRRALLRNSLAPSPRLRCSTCSCSSCLLLLFASSLSSFLSSSSSLLLLLLHLLLFLFFFYISWSLLFSFFSSLRGNNLTF